MVSVVWSLIAASLGLLVYFLIPFLAQLTSIHTRIKIGDFYYSTAARSMQRATIIAKLIGGYTLLPFSVNHDENVAEVTLSSSMISSDKKLSFTDPADRLKRAYSKPLALVVEGIPAAIDAELAELGYWKHQHELDQGLETSDGRVNPYMTVETGLRVVNPKDIIHLLVKDIDSENIQTARELTKQRYRKYGDNIGMAETLGTLTGFAFGIGGVAVIAYINNKLLDNSSGGGGGGFGGGPTIPLGTIQPTPHQISTIFELAGVVL